MVQGPCLSHFSFADLPKLTLNLLYAFSGHFEVADIGNQK